MGPTLSISQIIEAPLGLPMLLKQKAPDLFSGASCEVLLNGFRQDYNLPSGIKHPSLYS